MTIEERIKKCLKEVIENPTDAKYVDEMTLESDLQDYEFNSILFIATIVALEKEFDIEFDDEELLVGSIKTFSDLVSCINTKVEQNK